jgi:hypothetical protein
VDPRHLPRPLRVVDHTFTVWLDCTNPTTGSASRLAAKASLAPPASSDQEQAVGTDGRGVKGVILAGWRFP